MQHKIITIYDSRVKQPNEYIRHHSSLNINLAFNTRITYFTILITGLPNM